MAAVPQRDDRAALKTKRSLRDFIGIVRGRTATSDRGGKPSRHAERVAAEKSKENKRGTSRQRPP